MGKRIFVGNLNYDTTEDALIAAFEQDGRSVVSARVMTDRDTGMSRGFAFVEMASEEDAHAAIQTMDGIELDGRKLRVNEAEERKPRPGPGPGGGGNGGSRGRHGQGGRPRGRGAQRGRRGGGRGGPRDDRDLGDFGDTSW